MRAAHERLLDAIGTEWERCGPIAARAKVNRLGAGQMLASLYRLSLGAADGVTIQRRQNEESGDWEYRR